MERRNVYFSTPVWERLKALSAAEETPMADILRRLLSDALGITEDVRIAVEDAADEGDPVPKLRRTVIKEQLERSKLANQVMRLRLDLDDLAGAEAPRQEAWENLQGAFAQLHHDMQQHVDRSEGLFKQFSQTVAGLYQGLVDVRRECEGLRAGLTDLQTAEAPRRVGWQQLCDSMNTLADRLEAQDARLLALYQAVKQIGLINLDTLRRLSALESGIIDEQTAEARQRGDEWVSRVESELLIASSDAGERGEHE